MVVRMLSTAFLVSAATLILCYAACGRRDMPEYQAQRTPFSTKKYTSYTARALRHYSPPESEIIEMLAPPPKVVPEVAGVVFEPGMEVTIDDAKFLNRFPNLYLLSLEGCSISRDFWKNVSLVGVRYLYVDESNTDDLDCVHIANARNLAFFSIFRSSITTKGTTMIQESVPNVTIRDWYE